MLSYKPASIVLYNCLLRIDFTMVNYDLQVKAIYLIFSKDITSSSQDCSRVLFPVTILMDSNSEYNQWLRFVFLMPLTCTILSHSIRIVLLGRYFQLPDLGRNQSQESFFVPLCSHWCSWLLHVFNDFQLKQAVLNFSQGILINSYGQ